MRTSLFFGIAITLSVFTLCAFYSCKPSPGKAMEYYNQALDYQQAVLEKEDVLIQIINREMKKTLADSATTNIPQGNDTTIEINTISEVYSDFHSQIEASLAQTQKLGNFDGKTFLLDASVSLLETYKRLSEKEYLEVVEIVKIPSSLYTNENDNRFLDLTEHIDTCLQNEIDNFTRMCKEFSREYQFTIEEPRSEIIEK